MFSILEMNVVITNKTKLTAKQIEQATEKANKFLKEQEECLAELKTLIENKEISVVDLMKSFKAYRNILDNRNKSAHLKYDKKKEANQERRRCYEKIKDKLEAYKEELIKGELEKTNKEVLDLSNNLIMTEKIKRKVKPVIKD